MRVGGDVEGEGAARGPLCPEGVLGPRRPGSSTIGGVPHPVVVAGVGRETREVHLGGLTCGSRLGGRLPCVRCGRRAEVVVERAVRVGYDLDRHGGVGRPTQHLLSGECDDGGLGRLSERAGHERGQADQQRQHHEQRRRSRGLSWDDTRPHRERASRRRLHASPLSRWERSQLAHTPTCKGGRNRRSRQPDRLGEHTEGRWLCVSVFRRVCPCRNPLSPTSKHRLSRSATVQRCPP